MPAHVSPVADEKDGLVAYLAQQLDAFRSVAFGLTDDQARATPTPSALSVGALVKHATGVSRGWMARVTAAPEPPPADDRPFEQRVADYQDEFVMREDETLDGILQRFDEQAERTLRQLRDADLDTPVPVPTDAPWFPDDVTHWSVRWVALHLLEELARHAGHADIIREQLDGVAVPQIALTRDGVPAGDFFEPYVPAPGTIGAT
jgi:uncharacterized damage-inducible protein DinB